MMMWQLLQLCSTRRFFLRLLREHIAAYGDWQQRLVQLLLRCLYTALLLFSLLRAAAVGCCVEAFVTGSHISGF